MGSHGEKDPNCPNCGKMLTDWERACWHCEVDLDEVQNKSQKPQCFIATVVYGEHAWQTQLLRDYRDDSLSKSFFGRVFIDLYYLISPFIAKVIGYFGFLQKPFRYVLDFIVKLVGGKK